MKEFDEETLIESRKIQFTHNTTNKDLQKVSDSPGKAERSLKLAILENNREGNMVMVPMNCFLGNTSYTNNFIECPNPQMMEPIRPANLNQGGHKFKAESMYKAEFNSTYHQEQASGPVLKAKTQEQRSKTNNFGMQQRTGTLGKSDAKFSGETQYQFTSKASEKQQRVRLFKPMDTLSCNHGFKLLGRS